MDEPKTREEARTADDATISSAHRSTITVSDLKELVDATREILLRFNQDTAWWRGHAEAEWLLEPHAFRRNSERLEKQFYSETALMGHFVSRAPSRSHRPCPDNNDYLGWLSLAQHYGLPTRLLDWTENPLVAVYFAVERPDEDGCIWALSPTGLNRASGAADGLVQIRDPNVKKIAESAFRGTSSPEEIIALDGQEIDPRMLAQMSRFTLHSNRTPLEQVPESAKSANWLRQFVIPKNAKATIRKQLSAFGISDRVERTRVANASVHSASAPSKKRCEHGCASMPVEVGLLHFRIGGPSRGRLTQSCACAR